MRVHVVHCHPNPASLTSAVRDRVVHALQAGGHDVDLLDLYGLEPELTAPDRPPVDGGAEPWRRDLATRLRRSDAVVLVYPTWWSGPPALLQAWLDRVWGAGAAYEPSSSRVRLRLRNVRRFAVVTTHGSSFAVNVLEGQAGRALLHMMARRCHPRCRFVWLAAYDLDRADDRARERFLARVDRAARRW